ncbi:MAG: amidohydrolase, partial [Mangrovicoccus sp.]
MIRLAAAAYPIERLGNWHALETKLAAWMAEAKAGGADLAVLPEYAGVEAALIDGPDTAEVSTWCVRAADAASDYLDLVQNLA